MTSARYAWFLSSLIESFDGNRSLYGCCCCWGAFFYSFIWRIDVGSWGATSFCHGRCDCLWASFSQMNVLLFICSRNWRNVIVDRGFDMSRRRLTANWFHSSVNWLYVKWNSIDLIKWNICWMNIWEEINFISINEYVYFINCDSVINVLILNRSISVMYHRFRSVSRKKSRFNSINFIEYHINAKSRKHVITIDLTSECWLIRSLSLSIKT